MLKSFYFHIALRLYAEANFIIMQPNLTNKAKSIFQVLGAYFIAFVLFVFAFPKLYNGQFQIYYHAGFVPLNETSLFTHAWSFFGRSYAYILFIGLAEFTVAFLLLFPRTRLLGLLGALALFSNILLIDIAFEVKNAVGHVAFELTLVVLLLIPYLKHLKKFFWDLQGQIDGVVPPPIKRWKRLFPWAFSGILLAAMVVESQFFLQKQRAEVAQFELSSLQLGDERMELRPGKYTPKPMLFLEFGNTAILSVNDSVLWANYQRQGDSLWLQFDQAFAGQTAFSGRLNPATQSLIGKGNTGITMQWRLQELKLKQFPRDAR